MERQQSGHCRSLSLPPGDAEIVTATVIIILPLPARNYFTRHESIAVPQTRRRRNVDFAGLFYCSERHNSFVCHFDRTKSIKFGQAICYCQLTEFGIFQPPCPWVRNAACKAFGYNGICGKEIFCLRNRARSSVAYLEETVSKRSRNLNSMIS